MTTTTTTIADAVMLEDGWELLPDYAPAETAPVKATEDAGFGYSSTQMVGKQMGERDLRQALTILNQPDIMGDEGRIKAARQYVTSGMNALADAYGEAGDQAVSDLDAARHMLDPDDEYGLEVASAKYNINKALSAIADADMKFTGATLWQQTEGAENDAVAESEFAVGDAVCFAGTKLCAGRVTDVGISTITVKTDPFYLPVSFDAFGHDAMRAMQDNVSMENDDNARDDTWVFTGPPVSFKPCEPARPACNVKQTEGADHAPEAAPVNENHAGIQRRTRRLIERVPSHRKSEAVVEDKSAPTTDGSIPGPAVNPVKGMRALLEDIERVTKGN